MAVICKTLYIPKLSGSTTDQARPMNSSAGNMLSVSVYWPSNAGQLLPLMTGHHLQCSSPEGPPSSVYHFELQRTPHIVRVQFRDSADARDDKCDHLDPPLGEGHDTQEGLFDMRTTGYVVLKDRRLSLIGVDL